MIHRHTSTGGEGHGIHRQEVRYKQVETYVDKQRVKYVHREGDRNRQGMRHVEGNTLTYIQSVRYEGGIQQ